MTFKELYEKYINYKKIKLKAQSIRSIESRFNIHILPFFNNYNVNEITNDIYIKWKREIEQKCYKHKYNSALHIAMVNIFNGIKFYNIKQNIPSLTGNFINKTEIYKNPTYWDFDEFKKFINVIEDKLYKTLFETLYFTGIRIGEALALNWNDYNSDYLIITKTISKEYHNEL